MRLKLFSSAVMVIAVTTGCQTHEKLPAPAPVKEHTERKVPEKCQKQFAEALRDVSNKEKGIDGARFVNRVTDPECVESEYEIGKPYPPGTDIKKILSETAAPDTKRTNEVR